MLIFASTVPIQADLITTLFASDNGGSNGGAVYFDIDVLNPSGITIHKISVNTEETFSQSSIQVYTRSDSYSGAETVTAGWTLVSSGLGGSAALNTPTEFDVADFSLGLGVSGIALVSANDWSFSYTNGTGSNEFYSDSNLSLTLGSASNIPFTASIFSPRVWNGSIEYSPVSTVPEPSSIVMIGLCVLSTFYRSRRKLRSMPKDEVRRV